MMIKDLEISKSFFCLIIKYRIKEKGEISPTLNIYYMIILLFQITWVFSYVRNCFVQR